MSTVLLIGASRGIGLELARQYRQDGWRVIATARDEAGLARLRALDCEVLRVDVADPASNSGLAWQLDGEKLDLVVHVAGVIDREPMAVPVTRERFDHIMHTNVLGVLQALPQVAPLFVSGGAWAVVSSIMGSLQLTTSPDSVLYRVSKAAVNMVLRSAQAQYPGLIMVAMHPGWVRTEMGGPGAAIDVEDSARDLRRVLTQLQPRHKGQFINHDGSILPW